MTCSLCNGSGYIIVWLGMFSTKKPCPHCHEREA